MEKSDQVIFLCKDDGVIEINRPVKYDALCEAVGGLISDNNKKETSDTPETNNNKLSPSAFSEEENSHEKDYSDLIEQIKVDTEDIKLRRKNY